MSRRFGRRCRADDGVSLVELSVAMALMSVVTLLFTGGLIQVVRSATRTELGATAQQQLTVAFNWLDRQVRHATALSVPGDTGTYWYAEFLLVDGAQRTCTALRVAKAQPGMLWRRSWPYVPGATAVNTPAAWIPLVGQVTYTDQPFLRQWAGAVTAGQTGGAGRQQLRVRLTAVGGVGGNARERAVDVVFTAHNTSAATDSDTVCREGRTS